MVSPACLCSVTTVCELYEAQAWWIVRLREFRIEYMLTGGSQYIAEHYWPQDLALVDELRFMEMYRNAIYLERVEYEHRLVEDEEEAKRLQAEEEEEEPRLEALQGGFVDEAEQDVPGLIDEDVWRSPGEEKSRPVSLLWEVMPELEIDETEDEGEISMEDDGSWKDCVTRSWGQPKGG